MNARLPQLAAALALVLTSAVAQASLKIQHWTTPQGTPVYFVETHALPIVDVQVDFRAAGMEAPAGKAGIAGLTHGLLGAGAGGLSEQAISDRVADLGVQLGGGVDMDRASLNLRTLSNPAERDAAVALLATLIQKPNFEPALFERNRAQLVSGLKEALTQPATLLSRSFNQAIYPSHPYGRVPTVETLESITRDEVQAFYRANYTARRASVSIVGDLSRADAEALALRLTEGLPAGEPAPVTHNQVLPDQQQIRLPHPAAQAHIALGMPAIRRGDPDFFPLLVGNYVLGGGGFVSRLTKEVRDDRGYAYSVYSYVMPQRDVGSFQIGLQTKGSQVDDALKVVNRVLDDFLAQGPTAAEVQAAKDNLVNGFALRLDSNRKMLEQVAVIGNFGLPLDYLDTYQDKVKAVTPTQIREAFRRHVQRQHLVTVVVGGDGDKGAARGTAP